MTSKRMCWITMAVLVGLSAGSLGEAQTVFPGTDWQEATPESQGVDSAKLKEAVAYLDAHAGPDGAKELVIVRNGRLIWAGPRADAYHTIFSCTKTFTSTVLGLLVEDGKCTLDSPAVALEPTLADEYPLYAKIKLRHLASMCGGYRGEVKDVRKEDQPWGDVMAYLNPRQPAFEAGTAVQYNDHDVFLLGKILTLLVREPLQDVFQRRIAGPIGMTTWEWGVSGTVEGLALNNPPGNPGGRGAGGIKITPREMARFGLLMLNRGHWDGRQLLSASFADEATSNRVPVSIGFRNRDFRGRYGYYWWVNGVMADGKRPWPSAPPRTYMSHGNGGNFCCVVPEWNLVLVRMGSPSINDRLWEAFFARLAEAISQDPDTRDGVRVSRGTRDAAFPISQWQRRSPAEMGMDGTKLDEIAATLGSSGCLVKDGCLIKTWGNLSKRYDWYSSAKPIFSTLLFFAIQEGKVSGVDEEIGKWGWPLQGKDRGITFRHLANMTSGYMQPEGPGSAFAYNDFAIALFIRTLERVFGQSITEAAKQRIYDPLGMQDDPHHQAATQGWKAQGRAWLSARDWARLAWLWMNKGRWNGRQLLPESFFDQCMKPQVPKDLPYSSGPNLFGKLPGDTLPEDYLGVRSYGGGSNHNNYGPGIYGFCWWFNRPGVVGALKLPSKQEDPHLGQSFERIWPGLPAEMIMTVGWGINTVMVPGKGLVLVCAEDANWGRPYFAPGNPVNHGIMRLLIESLPHEPDSKPNGDIGRENPRAGRVIESPVSRVSPAAPARKVGDWEIGRWPGLAVVADPRGDLIHLVYGDDQKLYYTRGTDSGQSWSKPDLTVESGMHPRLALDSARTLHLVYCTPRVRFPGDRIPKEGCYLTLRDGKWSSPIKVSQPDQGAVDVRIAVDGDDNVHVIYWSLGTPSGELGEHDNHRCYYRRKPAGSSDFEEALCFENSLAAGPSSHGALAVGPQGEVHILYRTFQTAPTWTGNLEHRIREKDGAWRGPPQAHRGVYLADYSLSAAVDAQGTLHVAGYTFRPGGFRFKCYRKELNGDLKEVFVEEDTYGTSTDIMQTPSGDLWLTGSGNWSTRSRVGTPRSSSYHYDAAKRQWEKQFLSPQGSINVDTFCLGPRLLRSRDRVRVFYAEKRADESFGLYQKILSEAKQDEAAPKPLHRTVDLSLGESQAVELSDGKKATVKLLDLQETRDEMSCSAVREARVKVEVNGQPITLTSATYHLPVTVAGVQIDSPITKGYVQNARTNRWGLDKDARLRLWPAGSPWIAPGTFVYPALQRWFASDTQMANEPVFVNGDEKPQNRNIYYHWGLDIGGCEGRVDMVCATDGLVVSDGKNVLPGHENIPGIAPTYDEVNILDARGWYYCYCHLKSIDPAVRLGQTVKMGQKIGVLGKEGGSGGWSHLHFHILARQPSGKWGIEEGYAFLWHAYLSQYSPALIAVARPHHFVSVGQNVTLDGTRSWSAAGSIASYEWTFTDGQTATGAKVERTYDRPGVYSEVLKITDAQGGVDYDFAVVQIVDKANPGQLPPTIHATYAPTFGIRPGDEVTFKVRTFRTTDGEETWDFGDGSPTVKVRSDGNVTPRAADGYAETVHRYAKPGHYLVRVERSAQDGSKAVGRLQVRVDEDRKPGRVNE